MHTENLHTMRSIHTACCRNSKSSMIEWHFEHSPCFIHKNTNLSLIENSILVLFLPFWIQPWFYPSLAEFNCWCLTILDCFILWNTSWNVQACFFRLAQRKVVLKHSWLHWSFEWYLNPVPAITALLLNVALKYLNYSQSYYNISAFNILHTLQYQYPSV